MKLTGWMFTDARQVACVKCGAVKDEYCRTPKGRKSKTPHGERTSVLVTLVGVEPFKRPLRNLSNSNIFNP